MHVQKVTEKSKVKRCGILFLHASVALVAHNLAVFLPERGAFQQLNNNESHVGL